MLHTVPAGVHSSRDRSVFCNRQIVTLNNHSHIKPHYRKANYGALKGTTTKEKIRSGKIKTHQRTHFSTGTVFDITQTTCLPEDYPTLYHMGYPSKQHAALADVITAYATAKGCRCCNVTEDGSLASVGDPVADMLLRVLSDTVQRHPTIWTLMNAKAGTIRRSPPMAGTPANA